jgi:YHS domain-containing protein
MGRLAAFLLDAIVLFLIVRMAMRWLTGGRGLGTGGKRQQASNAGSPERVGGHLVRDPHCGTFVAPSSAVPLRSGGHTLYFCSTSCRDAYRPHP